MRWRLRWVMCHIVYRNDVWCGASTTGWKSDAVASYMNCVNGGPLPVDDVLLRRGAQCEEGPANSRKVCSGYVGVGHYINGEKDSENMTREMVKGIGMMEKRKYRDGDELKTSER